MVFFSDAVFAIVITLLVLPITAEVELDEAGRLAEQVWALWPRILSFAISFMVIGQFWIAHHRIFGYVRRIDRRLLVLNLVGLLTITFLPLPTAVLGAVGSSDDSFAPVFYAASMAAASLALTMTWLYALRAGFVDGAAAETIREVTLRSIVTLGVFLVSIGAGFFGFWAAVVCWVLLIPLARRVVLRVLDR
jgi:uncharacterized membrane protein